MSIIPERNIVLNYFIDFFQSKDDILSYDIYEFFYIWFDDIFRKDIVKSIKEKNFFSDIELKEMFKFNEIMEVEYKNFTETENFSEEMWSKINEQAQVLLSLPSIKKDIELLKGKSKL